MEEKLLKIYNELLSDLLIGYPLNQHKIDEIILLIHQLHFVAFSDESRTVLKILEKYG